MTERTALATARIYVEAIANKDIERIISISADDIVCTSPIGRIAGTQAFRGTGRGGSRLGARPISPELLQSLFNRSQIIMNLVQGLARSVAGRRLELIQQLVAKLSHPLQRFAILREHISGYQRLNGGRHCQTHEIWTQIWMNELFDS